MSAKSHQSEDPYLRQIDERGLKISELDGFLDWDYDEDTARLEYEKTLDRHYDIDHELSDYSNIDVSIEGNKVTVEAEHDRDDVCAAGLTMRKIVEIERLDIGSLLSRQQYNSESSAAANNGP